MSPGPSVAPVNTQLWTVGGSKVQGKYIKKMYWTWRFSLSDDELAMFMILRTSLNFFQAFVHLQEHLTGAQGSCSTQREKPC